MTTAVEVLDSQPEQEQKTALAQAEPGGIVRAVCSPAEMAAALVEYRGIQKALDEAMPDAIMEIQGKPFRKKAYWRAVATACGLSLEMVSESLERGEKDWGYLCTYRAIAPNGRSATGDGAVFASEKRGAATVHNVRAHAQTRAANRAISALCGFGEVSAEELDQ